MIKVNWSEGKESNFWEGKRTDDGQQNGTFASGAATAEKTDDEQQRAERYQNLKIKLGKLMEALTVPKVPLGTVIWIVNEFIVRKDSKWFLLPRQFHL